MAKKIFVVDDDPDFVEAIRILLDSSGFDVSVAYDGEECMERIKDLMPDLVVLDVMMPGKNGYEVCKMIKADEELREIPIILLTAVVSRIPTSKYTVQMGMETEAEDYIDKPVEPEVLLKRINALLNM